MLTAGTTVSGYQVEGLLGEGGMATVYEAHQMSLGRVVALKVLDRRFGDDPSFRERFRRESHIQARLDHPNIVPIYEAGESEHGLWLAMRLVRGPTLRQLLHGEKLTPARTLKLLAPIARALDAAHESGLIHRDITPQNILIDEREHPYLSDFGITKAQQDRSLTRTGQFVGTLDYVAPEQIRDEASTAATDTYALAAILFECLTGRVPFERKTEAAVLYAHLSDRPPTVVDLEPGLPKAIDPVLSKGLAKSPADRYETATELVAAAERALGAGSPARPAPERPPAGKKPSRLLRPAAVIASLVLLALVSVGFGALSGDGSEPDSGRAATRNLAVDLPSGWRASRQAGGSVPGLPLTDAAILEPASGGSGESAEIGISAATGKSLLPVALRRRAVGAASAEPVSLGSLQALRYLGLRASKSAAPLAVFAVPTSVGVATLVCRPHEPGTAFDRLCERLASSLELRNGRAYPLGPSPRLAVALRHHLDALNKRRASLGKRLAATAGADRQAEAASGLAAAFRRTARALSPLDVTPQSVGALAALVQALRSTRDGYLDLTSAARREDVPAYDDAAARVRADEAAVDRRLAALRPLGYRIGASE